MIIEDVDGRRRNYSGYPDPYKTKADEVEKLVNIASDCGIEKDVKLFDYLVNLVYRGNSSYHSITPKINTTIEDIGKSADVDELIDQFKDKLNKSIGGLA